MKNTAVMETVKILTLLCFTGVLVGKAAGTLG